MSVVRTETETVIKKILPYLERRGYDKIKDFDYESISSLTDSYSKGFVDILVLHNNKPAFLVEAKRSSKKLSVKDRDQAIKYAKAKEINVPFVVVTNGIDFQCFNSKTKARILWDSKPEDKVPNKTQLPSVLSYLRANPEANVVSISNDTSLPFRPGVSPRKLNALFSKGHGTIRKIEKNEEYAFADFSKLLFLKLLEEKSDLEEDFELPYSYRFYELANTSEKSSDQVKTAIQSMIETIKSKTPYGDVLDDEIRLKNSKTFLLLVKDLSAVSFCDCSIDSKGAAFEYYVRATLKGKKLGQYFTPRPLVRLMSVLVGENKIINAIKSGTDIRVVDPACGTGGFLVFMMQDALSKLHRSFQSGEITRKTYDALVAKIKEEAFYGSDANESVAASAKMNMIIAGDGHTNIRCEDSLAWNAKGWSIDDPSCDIILTNPPFGTSEVDSLSENDMEQFEIRATKGQQLFIQKMISSTVAGGEICTVIDEGLLNTDTSTEIRKYILQQCRVKCVACLPSETFKPNKINVRSSVLLIEKREHPDYHFEDNYKVTFCQINSLGYLGSGENIRGFDFEAMLNDISINMLDQSQGSSRQGNLWNAYDVDASLIGASAEARLDYKFWNSDVRSSIEELINRGGKTIREINQIETSRGKSPSTDSYVDKDDGYAIVIKAGSIGKQGSLEIENADWIEKSLYEEFVEKANLKGENINLLEKGDVLLASTGDGTLGKACVYDINSPAIADTHVSIIRTDKNTVDPYYLADYLRAGFGSQQIGRFYTGSTGLIELTPDCVNEIVVDLLNSIEEQKKKSRDARKLESKAKRKIEEAEKLLREVKAIISLK